MSADTVHALELFYRRINEKKMPTYYDMELVENAKNEILRLRRKEAIMEIELITLRETTKSKVEVVE